MTQKHDKTITVKLCTAGISGGVFMSKIKGIIMMTITKTDAQKNVQDYHIALHEQKKATAQKFIDTVIEPQIVNTSREGKSLIVIHLPKNVDLHCTINIIKQNGFKVGNQSNCGKKIIVIQW